MTGILDTMDTIHPINFLNAVHGKRTCCCTAMRMRNMVANDNPTIVPVYMDKYPVIFSTNAPTLFTDLDAFVSSSDASFTETKTFSATLSGDSIIAVLDFFKAILVWIDCSRFQSRRDSILFCAFC